MSDTREREILIWLTSRLVALTLYGVMGIEVGAATLFAGGPPIADDQPAIRVSIGVLALVGGLLTVIGSYRSDREQWGWWLTLVGTVLMAGWMAVVGTSYFFVTMHEGILFGWPWDPVRPTLGRLYIPLLYQSIFFLIVLHIITLLRLGRPHRD